MDTAGGSILVVDDDPSLLKLMTAYLSRLGYRVVCCNNSDEAWGLVQADPTLYSLALVDLNMPGMRGEELARRILACNASIRLIVASGYPAELSGLADLEGRVSFLHKPFAPKELAKAVGAQTSPTST